MRSSVTGRRFVHRELVVGGFRIERGGAVR